MLEEQQKIDLVVAREFDAPVEEVWKAWVDPTTLMKWWGPDGFTSPVARIDLREGGTSLVGMSAPEFGDMFSIWQYQKIVPLQLIEFVHNLADKDGNKISPASIGMPPDFPEDQLQRLEFSDLGGGKTRLTVTEFGWTQGQMVEMSRLGLEQSLNKLAALS
jgi:uncharacterized protein YndB with AHSA1/START domain